MSEARFETPQGRYDSEQWALHRAVSLKTVGLLLMVFVLLGISAHNTEMDKAALATGKAALALVGVGESRVVAGAAGYLEKAFPLAIASRTETNRLDHFDPAHLPPFTHIEVVEEQEYSALTETFTTVTSEYLVHPFGYLLKVLGKMWETIEMAFWGTLLSVMIALPLSVLASKNYAPNTLAYGVSRTWLGFHRAMPELIIALFFVLMYGFGPIAGVLALAVHTSGVLGKFFADEIENAPPGPQTALRSSGAGRLKVLRMAVFPQVFPAYVAYVQYIFERNIRTATVLGIVGAGGIGMELKGRWDMFDYDHVSTILLVIFITVMVLEFISQKLRGRAI